MKLNLECDWHKYSAGTLQTNGKYLVCKLEEQPAQFHLQAVFVIIIYFMAHIWLKFWQSPDFLNV